MKRGWLGMGCGMVLVASAGAAPPSPVPADEHCGERVARLEAQVKALEDALAEERARREALDARAEALFEILQRLHGQVSGKHAP